MKLTSFQLAPHLAKKLLPVYLVSGDDYLQKEEALGLIRAAAHKAGLSGRSTLTVDAGFDWDQLYSFLFATSLLADKQILELSLQEAAPPKGGASILCDYLSKPPQHQLLLINSSKADAKITKSAWYQAVDKLGAVIPIWPLPPEQVPNWVIERGKKAGLTIQRDAAQLLCDFYEGNLSAAAQAIEKLSLLNLNKPIDTQIVTKALHDDSAYTLFDFVDHLIAGDSKKALHILETLKSDGIDPVLILWAITRELRLLARMARELKAHRSYEQIYQSHRVFARKQPLIRRFLSRTSEEACENLLLSLAAIDRMSKGAAPFHAWDSLQLFCLRLV